NWDQWPRLAPLPGRRQAPPTRLGVPFLYSRVDPCGQPVGLLHGWAFRSYIVGLTLAVNLWACGQPVGLRSTCGLAVKLWACGQPGACADSLAVSRIHG